MNAELWLAIVLGFLGGFVFCVLILITFIESVVKKVSIGKDEEK